MREIITLSSVSDAATSARNRSLKSVRVCTMSGTYREDASIIGQRTATPAAQWKKRRLYRTNLGVCPGSVQARKAGGKAR